MSVEAYSASKLGQLKCKIVRTGRSAEQGAFGKARCFFGFYVLIMGAVLDDIERSRAGCSTILSTDVVLLTFEEHPNRGWQMVFAGKFCR